MIRFKDNKENLFIHNKFIKQGVVVYMKHNTKLYQLIVPDDNLANNITRETYEDFRKLSSLRKENIKDYDFTLCPDKSAINQSKSLEKLLESNISNYIETFRRIKIWHAYVCMLIMTFNWSDVTNYDFNNQPINEYIINATVYISNNSSGVIKKLANKIYEEVYFLSKYFSDVPFKLNFGISLPISPEYKVIKNTYLIIILVLMVFIIIMIFLYYYKLKDA